MPGQAGLPHGDSELPPASHAILELAIDPDGFRNRNHRYGDLVGRENARRLREDPSVLDVGRRHVDRFSRDDPTRAPAPRSSPGRSRRG